MTGRMFGGERGAGGARGGEGRAGRKGGDADERGSKVTPPPEEMKKPVSAEVRSQRRGEAGWFQGKRRDSEKEAGGK